MGPDWLGTGVPYVGARGRAYQTSFFWVWGVGVRPRSSPRCRRANQLSDNACRASLFTNQGLSSPRHHLNQARRPHFT